MLLIRSSCVASEESTRLYVDIGEQFGRVHGLKWASRLAMLSRIEGGRTCRLLKTMKRYIILGRTVYLTQHQAAVSFPQALAQRQRSGKDQTKGSPDL